MCLFSDSPSASDRLSFDDGPEFDEHRGCFFYLRALLSAKGMFSGSDVARRFNETSTAFCRAFIPNSLSCTAFSTLIFRGLLCEPEAKSHFLAKCRLNIQGMPSWRDCSVPF